MHVERRQLSGAREWIDDAPRVSGAVVAELRAWAGAEDAAESEHTSVRSENLDSALRASTSALRASKKYHDRRPSRVSAAVLAELRAWAGAEDAVESERKSVRSENLDSALLALRASKKYHTAARSRTPEASGAVGAPLLEEVPYRGEVSDTGGVRRGAPDGINLEAGDAARC